MTRRLAFYAPLKSPGHPLPSGDRQVARYLVRALEALGHEVGVVSEMRCYLRDPGDRATYDRLRTDAAAERARIEALWARTGAPDLWVSYHPYYKSPDLLGPTLCRAHGIPWITVEASLSTRRSVGCWAASQDLALDAAQGARVNIALTDRDATGLHEVDPAIPVARLAPFFDAEPFLQIAPSPEPGHLVSVAMFRAGDKSDSYACLARALRLLTDLDWHLSIVGGGREEASIRALFAGLPEDRITWVGEKSPEGVRQILSRGAIYAWPGCGEAYGIAYLEAQAAGLPIAAFDTAGVPEVVEAGITGLLSAAGDTEAYAATLRRLLQEADLRRRLGAAGKEKVREHHSLDRATARIGALLERFVWDQTTS